MEASVTCNVYNRLVGVSALCTDSRTKSVAHSAKTAACYKLMGVLICVILSRPHLRLTYLGCDKRLAACQLVKRFDKMLRGKSKFVCAFLSALVLLFPCLYFAHPAAVRLLRDQLYQLLHNICAVADNLMINLYVLVYFSRVDVYMKYLCVGGEGLRITYYSV